MKVVAITIAALLACAAAIAAPAFVPTPPTWVKDQKLVLESRDPGLAANKKLVFDMWRAIIQGGHTELAPKYFATDYIQHNPNIGSGRDTMVAYMRATRPVRPIEPDIHFPVIAMVAEGPYVVVATVSYAPDPANPSKKYAGAHFDMFRIANGKIAEHWDNLPKDPALLHTDPNTLNKP